MVVSPTMYMPREHWDFVDDDQWKEMANVQIWDMTNDLVDCEVEMDAEGDLDLCNDFDQMVINDVYIKAIIESAILYTVEFDLWAPSIQDVKEITVQQKLQQSGLQPHKTGKRLGFLFKAEDEKMTG